MIRPLKTRPTTLPTPMRSKSPKKGHPERRSAAVALLAGGLLILGLTATGCAGPQSTTEATLFAWAQACNGHLATSKGNAYPKKSLDEIDSALTSGLPDADGWGNPIFYRQLRDDRYQLISAGPDGRYGNDDDVIVQNGKLKVASEVYASKPLKKE